jgi:hypothetical protein
MTDKLRAAAQAALEAMDCIYSPLHVREINKVGAAMGALRAALAEQDAAEWEVDYEVRVDTGYEEMWVAEASTAKEALRYAPQYVDEGTVRVYERRIKVIATMEARND